MQKKIIALILMAMLLFEPVNVKAYNSMREDENFLEYIYTLSSEYGISGHLVCAVIECESSWNSDAKNFDGTCIGLMQINKINFPVLHEILGVEDLYDPYQNVLSGVYMLADLIDRYESLDMVLICYNCGESRAGELREEGITSTNYSRKVQRYIKTYEELFCNKNVIERADKNIPLISDYTYNITTGVEYKVCIE